MKAAEHHGLAADHHELAAAQYDKAIGHIKSLLEQAKDDGEVDDDVKTDPASGTPAEVPPNSGGDAAQGRPPEDQGKTLSFTETQIRELMEAVATQTLEAAAQAALSGKKE